MRNANKCFIRRANNVFIVILYLFLFDVCEASTLDPLMILKGVESVRDQIPPSRLLLISKITSKITTNEHKYLVIFDRERRYFKTVAGGPPVQMLFNGSEVIDYGAGNYIYIRNLDMQTPEYIFDPRIIGISIWYGWQDTIQRCLFLFNQATKIELIGKEQIDNKNVLHIRLTRENDYFIRDFWIDDKNNFRVYQCKDCFGNETNLICSIAKSYYENEEYPWLPSRVETETYNGTKRTIQILKGEANIKIPENQWTLAGMDIPKNTSVIDERTKRVIGTWDGKRTIPLEINSKPIPKVSFGRPIILIILILLSVVPLTVVVIRNFRKKNINN